MKAARRKVLSLALAVTSAAAPIRDAAGSKLAASGVRVAGERSSSARATPHPGAQPDGATVAALLLHETVTSGSPPQVDTLLTVLAADGARVSYRGGAAILDVPGDRLVLLDAATRTYRATSLAKWEEGLSHRPASGAGRAVRFEPAGGAGGRIAGYACERYHLYTRHEVFPGEFEGVEEEIWVTRELPLPDGALDGYRRMLASLDRMDLDAVVERPQGIALRSSVRRRPEGRGPEADEIELREVSAVEKRDVPAGWFAIPAGYSRSDSSASEAAERR